MRGPTGLRRAAGRCSGCGTPAAGAAREGARSLFGCPVCGRTVEADTTLPVAVGYRRGARCWSTDREEGIGAALFIDREKETVTLTCWQTPFLEGASSVLSFGEFRKRFGL
jgi:hypothetical protein